MATNEPIDPGGVEAALDELERKLLEAGPAFESMSFAAQEAAAEITAAVAPLAAPSSPPPLAPLGFATPAAAESATPGAEPLPGAIPTAQAAPETANINAWMGAGAPVIPLPDYGPVAQPQTPAAALPTPPPASLPVVPAIPPAGDAAATGPGIMATLRTMAADLGQAMQGLTTNLQSATASLGSSAASAASGALAGLSEVVGVATGAFGAVTGAVLPFVQAFSPAVVEQFNMALSDLMAVVGVALTPVMEGLTVVAREVGAVLLPVMEQLQPVFAQLTQTVLAALLPAIDTWASVLQSLMPVITFVAEVLSNVATIARVAATFMAGWVEQLRTWAEALGGWMGSLLGVSDPAKSFTDWLRDALQEVGKAAILAAGYLARLIGGPDSAFLAGMIKSLEGRTAERKDATGLAAAQQGKVTTGTEFERSALAAAFVATGGGAEKRETSDWLKDILGQLREQQASKETEIDRFIGSLTSHQTIQAMKNALETIATIMSTAQGVGEGVKAAALDVKDHPVGFLHNPGMAVGAALGKHLPPWLFGR